MGFDFGLQRLMWLKSLSEEDQAKHLRGERPFTDDEWKRFHETFIANTHPYGNTMVHIRVPNESKPD